MRTKKKGFSLVELLVAMGIMATLLILGTSLFKQVGQGKSREAVRALILAGLNTAHSRALASGRPVAFVMTPYDQGRESELGRSFTLYEVRQDEVTGEFEAGEQLRRWALLPGRFIFSEGDTVSGGGQNAFNQSPVVSISVRDDARGQRRDVQMPAIIFGDTGRVIWPSGSAELELHLTEGAVTGGVAVAASDGLGDWTKRDIFVIGRQTGRARYLQTQ